MLTKRLTEEGLTFKVITLQVTFLTWVTHRCPLVLASYVFNDQDSQLINSGGKLYCVNVSDLGEG